MHDDGRSGGTGGVQAEQLGNDGNGNCSCQALTVSPLWRAAAKHGVHISAIRVPWPQEVPDDHFSSCH